MGIIPHLVSNRQLLHAHPGLSTRPEQLNKTFIEHFLYARPVMSTAANIRGNQMRPVFTKLMF